MSNSTYNEEQIDYKEKLTLAYNTAYYQYLEELRQSGATNMFGAAPYLQEEFGLDKREAEAILLSWMLNYDELLEDGVISR